VSKPESLPGDVGGKYRPRVNQFFSNHIHTKIQTLQRPHPEQHEIILFGEHDVISRRGASRVHDCKPHVALDTSAIRHNESLTSLGTDSEGLQHGSRNPRKLTSRVDQTVGQLQNAATLSRAFNADSRSEDSHFSHSTRPGQSPLIIVLLPASSQCL
jgi:hypothetical protein